MELDWVIGICRMTFLASYFPSEMFRQFSTPSVTATYEIDVLQRGHNA